MEYMLIFNEPMSEFDKANDPAAAAGYFGAWGAYVGELQASGIMVSGNGLQSPHTGTTLRMRNGKRVVQDGPYADAKEYLGGYFVVAVPSLDIALEWAAKSPAATAGSVEVRPILLMMEEPAA